MHWVVHWHTAAEVIHQRADAAKPHRGLTSWKGAKVRKLDVAVGKNYLTGEPSSRRRWMTSRVNGCPNGDGWGIEIHTLQVPEVLEIQKVVHLRVVGPVSG